MNRRAALTTIARIFVVGLIAVVSVPAASQAASPDPVETVRDFYGVLLATMKDGARLGQQGRYAKLQPIIPQVFDLTYMTRVAVGPAFAQVPAWKQPELKAAFTRYVIATWADRFDSYSGEQLEVTGAQPSGSGALVHTRIVKPSGEPVAIDYLMRRNGDNWQIADVYLTGTISELAGLRSQFTSVLRSQSIDELIAVLNRKAGGVASAASSTSPQG
jgi:phospholipid transport system substrate-binding protein